MYQKQNAQKTDKLSIDKIFISQRKLINIELILNFVKS